MDDDTRAFILNLVVSTPVIFFSLTIHEFMHAWTAMKCGDDTALRAGRVSLNPLNYNQPRRDDILVSGAGVAANLAVAIAVALFLRVSLATNLLPDSPSVRIIQSMLVLAMLINFGLFVFNLLPIPPLDGSHILAEMLPARASMVFRSLGRYGIFLLLGVILLNRTIQFDFMGFEGVTPLQVPRMLLVYVFGGPDVAAALYE